MGKHLSPDYSLVRNGVSLEEWLWKLLDASKQTRISAGEAIQAMAWGFPSVHTAFEDLAEVPDVGTQLPRFAAGVKEVFAKEGFNARYYVQRLVAF